MVQVSPAVAAQLAKANYTPPQGSTVTVIGGGSYTGPSNTGSTSTTPSSPTSSPINNSQGTYNPITKVYTSPTGVQQSMAKAPTGAVTTSINNFKTGSVSGGTGAIIGGSSGTGAVTGGNTYNPVTATYTSPTGVQQSMANAPKGANYISNEKVFSITPGGQKYGASEIAAASPGYSLAFLNHPIEQTKNYFQLKTGQIDTREYSKRQMNMEVKDISYGRTFNQEGVFKVQPDQNVFRQYAGVRSASPVVRIAESGAIGVGAGFVLGGAVLGATSIAPLAGSITKVGISAAGIIGTGLYSYSSFKQIQAQPDKMGKIEVFGEKVLSLGAMGLGYAAGAKSVIQIQGLYATRGREFIPLSKLTKPEVISGKENFPTIPKNQQLQAFKTGAYKEYSIPGEISGGKQGAFHTTSFRFYEPKSTSIITPKQGTSELPGLYGGPYVSPAFSKTAGSGYNVFNFKSMFTPTGKPGIAFLKPEGFRKVGFSYSSEIQFTGQKPVGGKFAYFNKPAKAGYADVPLMKTEAEAVFRTDAGSYSFQSGKYYTTINAVRTPIDVFGYSGGKGAATLSSMSIKRGGYGYPQQSSVYSPTSLIPMGSSNSKSSTRSISSITSSKISSLISPISSPIVKSSSGGSYNSYGSSIISPPPSSSSSPGFSIPSRPSSSSSVSYIPSSNIGPTFSIPKFNFGEGMGKRTLGKGKKNKYTPDFFSLVTGRKGKAPKTSTGLNIRPVTKGFSFNFGKLKL